MARSQLTLGQLCLVIAWLAPPLALFSFLWRQPDIFGISFGLFLLPSYVALGIALIARRSAWKSWIVPVLVLAPCVFVLLCVGLLFTTFAFSTLIGIADYEKVPIPLRWVVQGLILMAWISFMVVFGYGVTMIFRFCCPLKCPSCHRRRLVHKMKYDAPSGSTAPMYVCLRCGVEFVVGKNGPFVAASLDMMDQKT
jgi:hypothetical protein